MRTVGAVSSKHLGNASQVWVLVRAVKKVPLNTPYKHLKNASQVWVVVRKT